MLRVSLFFFSLLVGTSFANNDWSQPCLSGVCQYDLPSNGSASGTLKIWGPDSAISDITPAAGWQIIDCSPSVLQQDIRLVCASGSDNCTHLYSGSSDVNAAVGKVVRLPENCGQSAFAVVTKSWTSQDQSVPSNIAPSVVPVNGTKPTVRALHLSTNFSSVKPSSAGPVNFVLQAANVPGTQADLPTTPQQQRRSNSRILGRSVTGFVRDAVNGISSLNDFNITNSTTLPPVDVDKSFNLVDQSISCPPVDASVKIDVDAKAHAVASIGVAASGTIVPPEVSDFSIIAGLNADIDGSLDLKATASGTLDSGKIKLFEVGIPGLDFPGILTIGPSFEIDGQATATLDVDVDMTVGISYTIDNAQFTFPPKSSSSGSFNIGDTPLKLSASPSVTATGTVEAHLIPILNFGISALDNAVGATIFVELDASATMTLTGQALADAGATVNTKRDLSRLSSRGVYILSPPELNARQFDDSDSNDGDDADDADDADDSSEDDSADDGEGDVADNGDDDSADDDGDDDSADDAEDDQDDSEVDSSADVGDDSQDDSDTADDGDDGSDDDGEDDSQDASASTSDDDADATAGDGVDDANDSLDTSADNGDDDSQDDSADGSDTTDDSSVDSADDGDSTANASANVDDGSDDGNDTSDTADASNDADTSADADDTSADETGDDNADSDASSADVASNNTSTDTAPSTTSDSSAAASASPDTDNVLTSASATFGGCFSVDAALDVNAGATGNFFGLFDPSTKVDLFNHKFEIFKKCFGSSATPAQRRSLPGVISHRLLSRGRSSSASLPTRSLLEGRAFSLTCPSAAEEANGTQQAVTDETVPAAQITEE